MWSLSFIDMCMCVAVSYSVNFYPSLHDLKNQEGDAEDGGKQEEEEGRDEGQADEEDNTQQEEEGDKEGEDEEADKGEEAEDKDEKPDKKV